MINDSLFAPAPRRKRGLILTLSGSLLFHGSLIGVAALWPTRPVEPKSTVTIIGDFGETPAPAVDSLPPAAPSSEPEPVLPTLKFTEPTTDAPPTVEPTADDMSLATPTPRPATRTPSHPTSASPSTRTVHPPSSLPVGGPANSAAGHPGAGRPGAGVRWTTPKPFYPAALRLAHVHGSGSVRVTTDGSGRVISATIVQSTGSALLDDNTCRAARNDWSGPPNSTTSVPITYQIQ